MHGSFFLMKLYIGNFIGYVWFSLSSIFTRRNYWLFDYFRPLVIKDFDVVHTILLFWENFCLCVTQMLWSFEFKIRCAYFLETLCLVIFWHKLSLIRFWCTSCNMYCGRVFYDFCGRALSRHLRHGSSPNLMCMMFIMENYQNSIFLYAVQQVMLLCCAFHDFRVSVFRNQYDGIALHLVHKILDRNVQSWEKK